MWRWLILCMAVVALTACGDEQKTDDGGVPAPDMEPDPQPDGRVTSVDVCEMEGVEPDDVIEGVGGYPEDTSCFADASGCVVCQARGEDLTFFIWDPKGDECMFELVAEMSQQEFQMVLDGGSEFECMAGS